MALSKMRGARMQTMRHITFVVALIGLTACHGITPNQLPTQPAPVVLTAQNIHITIDPGELPIGGGRATVRLEVRTIDGRPVGNVPVTLSVDKGELGATAVTADYTGHAITTWEGTASATLRATSETASGTAPIVVREPIVLPPPPPPPPKPAPLPPDPPPPPQPAFLSVTLAADPDRIPEAGTTTLTARASNMQPGEMVTAYQWDFDGDGKIDETTISSSRLHAYPNNGIVTALVTITSSKGRGASATKQIVVYRQ